MAAGAGGESRNGTTRGRRLLRGLVGVAFVFLVVYMPTPVWVRVMSGVVLVPLWVLVGRPRRSSRPSWLQRFLRRYHFPGHERDPEFLRSALRDPETRRVAAEALADLRATEAIPDLLRLLDASDPHTRVAGAKALGQLRAMEATQRLREIVASDNVVWVRGWAAEALGKIGDFGSTSLLAGLLESPRWQDRMAAAHALGLLGDPAALAPIKEARRTDRRHLRYLVMQPAYRKATTSLRRAAKQQRQA